MREVVQITLAELAFVMAGFALLGVAILFTCHCRLNGRVENLKANLVDLPRMRKETDSWTEDTVGKSQLAESVLNGELPPRAAETGTMGRRTA
jgi:hypothetical protein